MTLQIRPAEIPEQTAPRTFQGDVDGVRVRLHKRLGEISIYADPKVSCLQVQRPEVIEVVVGSRMVFRKKVEDPMSGVRYAVALEKVGKKRRALDLLYRLVDSYFRRDDFAGCDSFLARVNVGSMGTHLMVGLLTVTAIERERLPSRKSLVAQIRRRMEKVAPDRMERLLSGLE